MPGRVSQFAVRYESNVQKTKKTLTWLSYRKTSFFFFLIYLLTLPSFFRGGWHSAFCIIQHESSDGTEITDEHKKSGDTVKTTEQ